MSILQAALFLAFLFAGVYLHYEDYSAKIVTPSTMVIGEGDEGPFMFSPEDEIVERSVGKASVILITRANHHNSQSFFISDIYSDVSELDGKFSPEIGEGEYVRVMFEESLRSVNDITLYSRVVSGNPKVEVYESGGNDIVAVFENVEGYNRIFLEGLTSESDSFDLKVIGGVIEIDYIVDPTVSNPPSSCAEGWLNCPNAFVDDTNTASLTGPSTEITGNWTDFGFNIPTGSTIDSVIVTTRRYGSHVNNAITLRVWDETGGGFLADTDLGGSIATCNTVVTNVTSQKAWTVNDVNNFLVQYERTGGSGGPERQWHICYIEVTVTYTLPPAPTYANVVTDPASPENYSFSQGYQFNSTWTSQNLSIHTVRINFNGTNFTVSDSGGGVYSFNLGGLSSGNYTYYWWANDTVGQTNQTPNFNYVINRISPSGSIGGGSPITYGTAAGISVSETNQGDGDVVYRLYRNGSEVSNPDNTILAVGNYTYVFNTTGGQNYTANSSLAEFNLTVNMAAGNVTTFVNNTRNNVTIERGSSIYLNATRVSGDSGGTLQLYLNGTLINQGTSGMIFNLTLFDSVGEFNVTGIYLESENYTADFETWFVTVEDTTAPILDLVYPENNSNFSSFVISQFNFTVNDTALILNCSLHGNWGSGWHLNQTILNPDKGSVLNFSSVDVGTDGYYVWNVRCTDAYENAGFATSNYTFATFNLPYSAPDASIDQSVNDGTGNVTFAWNSVSNAAAYRIYYSDTLNNSFTFLNQTPDLNYTDSSFSGERRRFYRVSAWNPTGENSSVEIFGAHVYSLRHNINTRNWLGFPTNASYLMGANDSLNEITGATAFTMWNETMQRRLTCNEFSCPTFPGCTESNCDFNIEPGRGYEVNLNSSFPSEVNWSLVGKVFDPVNLTLVKNSTSFGKNWISIYANTSLLNARNVLDSTGAEVVSRWDSPGQRSQGYLKFGPIFLGTNFPLGLEGSYEVAVSQTMNWTQV